jgi:hypothetical protein
MAERKCDECNSLAAYLCTFEEDDGCCDGPEGEAVALCAECANDKEGGIESWRCSYHQRFTWTVNGMFSKFGNNDGNGYYEFTGFVVDELEAKGYEVTVDSWGSHNQAVVTKIQKGNEQLYPPPENTMIPNGEDGGGLKPFVAGYDDVFLVLPNDVAAILRAAAASEEWKSEGCSGLGVGGDDY